MRTRGSAAVGGLLGIAVGAVALGLALRDVDPAALAAAFARAGLASVALGAALHVGVQLLYALRWRVLLGRPDLSAARAVGVVGLGYLANYTLPGRPGELVRAGLIRGLAGVPFVLALASLLLEKVLDGISILGSALAYSLTGELPGLLRGSVMLGAGTFAVAGALLLLVALAPVGRLPLPRWARERLAEVGGPVRNVARPAALLLLVLLGALIWLGIVALQAMLCLAVGLPPEPRAWLLLYAALGLASVVPGAPGYLGTYQLAAVLALGAFGIERELAFAVATLYQVSRLLGSLAVGAWAASREGLTALRIYWASTPGRDQPSSHHASSSPASER
ncbi:MAG TPA: lysylphosphatidylglycerol synthase transmembrane domain-containing protein [Chloroflexota bacterium]|jgi:hypothetical protein